MNPTTGCQLKPIKPFKPIFLPSNLINLFNCQKTYLNPFLAVKTFLENVPFYPIFGQFSFNFGIL